MFIKISHFTIMTDIKTAILYQNTVCISHLVTHRKISCRYKEGKYLEAVFLLYYSILSLIRYLVDPLKESSQQRMPVAF